MATFNQGIHGKFSGRVGNVVGSSWKGTGVMRIRPASVSNPRTPGQLNQRSRFGIIARFVQANRDLIKAGFRPWATGITTHNAAMSYNLTNALTGDYPDVSIDYSRIMLSRGSMAKVQNLSATFSAPDTLTLNWDNNTSDQNSQADNKLMVSLYDAETQAAIGYHAVAVRSAQTVDLLLPTDWAGKTVQVLAFFIASASVGSVDAKNQVSDTTFGGAVALI